MKMITKEIITVSDGDSTRTTTKVVYRRNDVKQPAEVKVETKASKAELCGIIIVLTVLVAIGLACLIGCYL